MFEDVSAGMHHIELHADECELHPATTAGLVAAAPLFGGPRSHSRANRALFRSVLAATDALTMAWLLSQYAFQVRCL